jgi:biopolymer transport protein ExbB/TolQ
MFQNLNLFEFFTKGGVVFFFLIICSVLSISLIIERVYHLAAVRKEAGKFLIHLQKILKNKHFDEAAAFCRTSSSPAANIFLSVLERQGKSKQAIEEALEREGSKLAGLLENRLVWLATTGSVTPFIGLFGTVLGIINAFKSISFAESFTPSLVANGIAEALLNTAAGLFVAVPAVVAYNILLNRNQAFLKDLETAGSELVEMLTE